MSSITDFENRCIQLCKKKSHIKSFYLVDLFILPDQYFLATFVTPDDNVIVELLLDDKWGILSQKYYSNTVYSEWYENNHKDKMQI